MTSISLHDFTLHAILIYQPWTKSHEICEENKRASDAMICIDVQTQNLWCMEPKHFTHELNNLWVIICVILILF